MLSQTPRVTSIRHWSPMNKTSFPLSISPVTRACRGGAYDENPLFMVHRPRLPKHPDLQTYTTLASRSSASLASSMPANSLKTSAVCAPNRGAGVTVTGESDSFTGHPGTMNSPRSG